MKSNDVICLMGLTGAGKTALAMALCDALPLELISVDSAMIYQGMDIGSAKPEKELLEKYPHHLIDVITPWQSYSAAQFIEDVNPIIKAVQARGNTPLLVGGTMMYFKALQQGLNTLPESKPALREALNQERESKGLAVLQQRLRQCDPISAAKINENDAQRIQRALEVFELTGKPMSDLLAQDVAPSDHSFINIALIPHNRSKLHGLIAQRFEMMLEQGFEEEVRQLKRQGLTDDLSSMRCVGYKQMLAYLNGQCSFDEMKQQAIAATRQLAKRQHTWLRKWPELDAFDPWQQNLLAVVSQCLSL